MNLVNEGNDLNWHSDVLFKHLFKSNERVLETFSKYNQRYFLIIEIEMLMGKNTGMTVIRETEMEMFSND